jgi:hypothetical protein
MSRHLLWSFVLAGASVSLLSGCDGSGSGGDGAPALQPNSSGSAAGTAQ